MIEEEISSNILFRAFKLRDDVTEHEVAQFCNFVRAEIARACQASYDEGFADGMEEKGLTRRCR